MEASDDEDGRSVVIEMEEDLASLDLHAQSYMIFTIRPNLRSGDDSFSPKLISIGPLHHGKPRLQAMEKHKKRYLENCLQYNPSIRLPDLVGMLKGMEGKVRGAYNQEHFHRLISSNQFVKMMLLDGCFILHLFLLGMNVDIARKYDETMFAIESFHGDVQYDLKLVENQLPFFLLEHLFNFILTDEQRGSHSFRTVTINYFQNFMDMGENASGERIEGEVKHLGDVLLNCFLPSIRYPKPPPGSKSYPPGLKTASELHNLGVTFKKSETPNLLDITFNDGVLEIPQLSITGHARAIFRNMIAMEQCHLGYDKCITDYVALMNYLVDTAADVRLLKSNQIIDSLAGSDEDVAEIFNTMDAGAFLTKESHYYGIIHDINKYSDGSWHKLRATVKKDYFSTPLKILSLLAAFVLLVATILGTLFTVLSFTK